MLNKMFKSLLEYDRAPVVICDLNHVVMYINPAAAKHYEKFGGKNIVGKSIFNCHNQKSCDKITRVIEWFLLSNDNNMIYTFRNERINKDVYMVALRDDTGALIGYYEKHEFRNVESNKLYDFSKSLI